MAELIFACDQIRRNTSPGIFDPLGTTGWPGGVALCDALTVDRAR